MRPTAPETRARAAWRETPMVAVDGVSKAYGRGVRALAGATLAVGRSELACIGGPPGSGKSTLLHLIAGFLEPDSGSIAVDGITPSAAPDPAAFRRERVGFVFQTPVLVGSCGALTNVEIALLGAGLHARERRRRGRMLLDAVGVLHRAEHLPGELSGGERQCVALARALANEPLVLLADEPTAALDRPATDRILDVIDERRANRGMTAVVVSHDPRTAARADRAFRVLDGVLKAAPAGEALEPERGGARWSG